MNINCRHLRASRIYQLAKGYSLSSSLRSADIFSSLKLPFKAMLLIFPALSWAGDPEWVGTTNTDWFDASNWNPNGVPNFRAIIDTNIPQSPIIAGAFNFALDRVTIGVNSTASLLLDGNGTLTLDDADIIGVNGGSHGTLTLQNGAVINSATAGNAITAGQAGTGTVTVTGAGSKIEAGMNIGTGVGGNGTLNVLNGGNVSTGGMVVGGAGNATINIDGVGSTITDVNNTSFTQSAGSTASLSITNGGTMGSNQMLPGNDGNITVLIDGTNSLYQTQTFGLAAGAAGIGSLTVSNGGRLLNNLATSFGSDGNSTILLKDPGSLVNGFDLYAASNAGSNTSLTVQSGGQITGRNLDVGGGTATVNVTGASAVITLDSLGLATAASGQTTLTVNNQGSIQAANLNLGDQGQATVTVDGAGSVLNGSFSTQAATNVGSTASITITNGGQFQNYNCGFGVAGNATMLIDGAGSVCTASFGTDFAPNAGGIASLTLQNQGKLSTYYGSIGGAGQATVVIDGASAELSSGDLVNIGASSGGQGTITVQNGGLLNPRFTNIGDSGQGSVTVTGAGSTVYYESGTLGKSSGGVGTGLATNQGSWGPFNTTIGGSGTGTLTIEGAGTQINVPSGTTIGANAGGIGTLTIRNQATGSFNQSFVPTSLIVGGAGQGTMLIQSQAAVTSVDSIIGASGPSGQGTLTIEDASSSFTGAQCRLGEVAGSTGTVMVHNNGSLTLDTAIVGKAGTGQLTYDGAGSSFTLNTSMSVGDQTGGNGTFTVRNSANANFTAATIIVGNAGTGNLFVQNAGSALTAAAARLGDVSGGNGTLTLQTNGALTLDTAIVGNAGNGQLIYDGAGSSFTLNTSMTVGNSVGGNGTFTVRNAAVFNSPPMVVGSAGTGNIVVQDASSSITGTTTALGDLATGNGTVTIQSSGTMSMDSAIVANAGTGTLIVDGATSNLSLATSLVAGKLAGSNGTVTLRNSATFASPPATIGEGGRGRLIVKDSGSAYSSATTPYIGLNNGSDGGLTLQSSGTATATEFRVAENTGSVGAINIGDEAGNVAAAPGTLAGNVTFGAGTGTAYFNHTSGNYTFSNVMNGPGRVIAKAGTTHFPNSKNYTGQTSIQGGTLVMDVAASIQPSSGVDISSGTFDITAGNQTIQDLSGSGGTVSLGAYRLRAGTANSTSYAGVITGTNAGELEKQGMGALTLTGTSTYSGTTRLSDGFVGIGSNAALGASGVIYNGGKARFAASGLTVANNINLSASGSSTFDLNGYDGTLSGVIAGANTSTFNPTNSGSSLKTITLTGVNTLQGNISIGPNTRVALSTNGTAGTAIINLTASSAGFDISSITPSNITIYGLGGTQGTVYLGAKTLTTNIATTSSYSGLIRDGGVAGGSSGKIIKVGTGELILAHANSFTGGVDLTQGTITVGDAYAAGTGPIEFKGSALDTRTLKIQTALTAGLPNDIKINADGFLDTQGYDVTFNGAISGSAALTKLGTGTLTLNGPNTFIGALLQMGDIKAGNNQALGAGDFTFSSPGTRLYFTTDLNNIANTINLSNVGIIHTGNNRVTITGPINGNSNLVKEGPGILELSNAVNGLAAQIVIQQGEVKINGTANAADVVINNASRLTGNFTVLSILNSGTVKPGNSIGVAQVLANYNNSNGTYACEINDAGLSDIINVTGTATLGGTLYVIPQPGDYSHGITYTILSAPNNPLAGTFTTVTGLSSLLRYTATYDANNAYLTVIRLALSDVVKLGNPGKVADYIEQLGTPPSGSVLEQLVNVLPSLNEAQMYDALNQLHPAVNGMIASAITSLELSQGDSLFAFSHMDRSLRRLKKRIKEATEENVTEEQLGLALSQNQASVMGSANYNQPKDPTFPLNLKTAALPQSVRTVVGAITLWLQQGASLLNQRSNRDDSPTIGVAGIKGDVYNALVGVDRVINSQVLIGAALGYNRMSYRLRKGYGSGKVDSYRLGVYGVWEPDDVWYFNAAAFIGYHDFRGRRHLVLPTVKFTNRQDHGGYHFNAIMEAGRDIILTRLLTLTPYAALGTMQLTEKGYTESGQGFNPRLRVKRHDSRFWQVKLGAQLSQTLDINGTSVYLYGKVGYTYKRYASYPQGIKASFADCGGNFKVFNYMKAQHMVNPGVGVIALLTDQVNISANYSAEIARSQYLHRAQLRLDYRF